MLADKISTESTQSVPNAPLDQVIMPQPEPVSLVVKMKTHQILSVFAGQPFTESMDFVANVLQEPHTTC